MSRARDAVLSVGLLVVVGLLGIRVDASIDLLWLLGGIAATILMEALAYRRPTLVQEQFERRSVIVGSLLLVAVGIVSGAILAPDRALSLAIGALATYLCLLAIVAVTGRSPAGET